MNKEVKLDIKIDKKNKVTIIKNIEFFDLIKTLESGQTFRYHKVTDKDTNEDIGAYVISKEFVTYMEMKEKDLYIYDTNKDVVNYFIDFFNLKTDYVSINKKLIKIDKNMKNLISYANGVRVIHTDLWETILTFIISANNNMSRIKASIELMSARYGKLLNEYDNVKFYEIPSPSIVNQIDINDIRDLKVGFRDKYIKDAADKITNDIISLKMLQEMNGHDAKEELMKIKGIGDKVADCIRLFALNKFESFPVDVWIERYMLLYDMKDEVKKYKKLNKKITRLDIEKYGEEKYKELAGYAQQYMFYYCVSKMKIEK